jgi:hypothetical protein
MSSDTNNDRRTFLHQVLGAGVAVAGTSLLAGCATTANGMSATAAAAPRPAGAQPATLAWDMSWQQKLGKYKTVFDSPHFDDGGALSAAALTATGYKAVYGGAEFTPVIVIRHMGIAMALNDAMWERMGAGVENSLKDPTTGEVGSKRNPFLTYTKGDKAEYIGPDSSLTALVAAGGIILACNRALTRLAGQLRKKEPDKFATTDLALQEMRRNLVPGAYPMPSGVFAVSAAQDAGCHYFKVFA